MLKHKIYLNDFLKMWANLPHPHSHASFYYITMIIKQYHKQLFCKLSEIIISKFPNLPSTLLLAKDLEDTQFLSVFRSAP